MKQFFQTTQFSKDVKRAQKQGKDLEKLKVIVRKLANDDPIDPRRRDHPLSGKWKHCRDCHVEPDWILIYTKTNEYLRLERTGTHSDLFE